LLTGQIDVENPDKNDTFSNIESTAMKTPYAGNERDVTVGKGIVVDRKIKIVTFITKFGYKCSINVMLEVKVKVGSRIRRICCIFDHKFNWIY